MTNVLYYGDNLDILRKYIKDNSIDLIYLDPPFNSKAIYNVLFPDLSGGANHKSKSQVEAFTDFWTWDEKSAMTFDYMITNTNVPAKVSSLLNSLHNFLGENAMSAYLVMMSVRLLELHRVLKDTGTLYLHCDPTASHYIKLILDSIFDEKNFRNEIIWFYPDSPGRPSKDFANKHDTIFRYAKSDKWTFNDKDIRIPILEASVERYKSVRVLGGREYLGGESAKIGKIPEDVWRFPVVKQNSREALGYQTQKPLALLERIIKASSNKGDIVLDPFCGCGTTIAASEKLGREWIGIDITHLAINLIKDRIYGLYKKLPNVDFEVVGEPKDVAGARDLALRDKYQFQWWAEGLVGGRPKEKKKGADKGIDGILYLDNPNNRANKIQVLISVKGGEHIKSGDIRDLKGTMQREGAKFGLFITLEEPTKPMKEEAASSGFETSPLGTDRIPKIQIITIKELLEDKIKPKFLQINEMNISYKKAEPEKKEPKEKLRKLIHRNVKTKEKKPFKKLDESIS